MNGPLRVQREPSGNWLMVGTVLGVPWPLTGDLADAIEAQLAGPDLTELRHALADALEVGDTLTMTPTAAEVTEFIVAIGPVLGAARRLVDGTDGAP